jgi:branched-subunit amino acid ABC-type transport system permease component
LGLPEHFPVRRTILVVLSIAIVGGVVAGSTATLSEGRLSGDAWTSFVVNGVARGSVYALIAMGYTLVYGILFMINFAHGEVFMAGTFTSFFVARALADSGFLNGNPVISIMIILLVAMAVSTFVAVLLERIAYRPLRGAPRLVPLIAAVVLAYVYRDRLFGLDLPIRIACVVALVILGWAFAMNLGRAIGPVLMKRLDPGTAGTVGFLIRLATLVVTVLVAMRLAGLEPRTLAVGGAITAVILGLAAQQTVGNLIAGTVLMSARPFRVGDRIRVHAGGVAGTVEGTVASLGLLKAVDR